MRCSMVKWLICIFLMLSLWIPATAADLTAPPVTGEAEWLMPAESTSFAEDLWYVIKNAVQEVMPDIYDALQIACLVIMAVIMLSILKNASQKEHPVVNLCAVACITCILLNSTNTMIRLGAKTVEQLGDYGMRLFPVLTAALAAQGGFSKSAALCTATMLFNALLSKMISKVLLPLVYAYLSVAIVSAAIGEKTLVKFRDTIRSVVVWALRTVLYVFTGYISITGAVSGSVDQVALKAAKVTISSAVPVVGSIMADASESVLVGAGVVKNAVGIYGCVAVIALLSVPFLKFGIEYGVLKLTGALCGMIAGGKEVDLLDDFGRVMGLLLAMTGAVSLMLLISIVCFLKGMGG